MSLNSNEMLDSIDPMDPNNLVEKRGNNNNTKNQNEMNFQ